jgi:hypothetical protein
MAEPISPRIDVFREKEIAAKPEGTTLLRSVILPSYPTRAIYS